MIDHLLGRPSTVYKRYQVLLVILFWTLAISRGDKNGPPLVRWFSRKIRGRLTPWQVIGATLTCLYAVKNADSLLGLQAPEPLARLYSRDFYRATWMAVALDTGFATAMHVRPKWLRDILSMAFSGYYLFFANEADEKLRRYRAVCTVEFLRTTWEKTNNPFIRLITWHTRPSLGIKRRIVLPRPSGSPYTKPVVGWLYYSGDEASLERCRNLVLDLPGGGFVCMTPAHHDERLHWWAKKKGYPILALEYSKAPEYPYPYALHECFDVYRLLHDTRGAVIGMRSGDLRVVLTGDSAGANIGAALLIKLLEMPSAARPPMPVSVIWTYPCLDFNFTSFMPPEHLRILRQESSAGLKSIAEQKDHLKHQSPLSVVEESPARPKHRRSWSKSFSKLPFVQSLKSPGITPKSPCKTLAPITPLTDTAGSQASPLPLNDGHDADNDGEGDESETLERDKTLSERVQYWNPDRDYAEVGDAEVSPLASNKRSRVSTLGTRLTMTSRTGFFQDRIISPSMMRAMAICYVGPRNSPDLSKNYYISPILTPKHLLAQFPPVYLLCGERDPFSDDTLIFAGRLRDAKLERKAELVAKQAKFGEGLRMSSAKDNARDPILDEIEEDWVTMRFIEGWSHGFMQMITLLPKVEQFFALTADWIDLSFAKNESQSYATSIQANAMTRVPTLGQESLSEKEEEVLSFVPRRRGSNRSSSPVPTETLRAQLQAEASSRSSSNRLSSSSVSDGATSASTAATSAASSTASSGPERRTRRTSPTEGSVKGGPVARVLWEEHDAIPTGTSGKGSNKRRASSFGGTTSADQSDSLAVAAAGSGRRPSDLATSGGIAATAFVETQDILKRRREDAVAGLGSAILSSDSDTEAPTVAL